MKTLLTAILGVFGCITIVPMFLLALYFIVKCIRTKRSKKLFSEFSGLENNAEKCYMNSMIQALASSEKLITKYEQIEDKYSSENMRIFVDILKNMNSPNSDSKSNTEKLCKLCERVQWGKKSQQVFIQFYNFSNIRIMDTFDLLSFFINNIAKDTKKYILPPKFQILHSFTENASFNKIQAHLALAVPLCGTFKDPPGVHLETLLDAFFEPSIIDDGPYKTVMSIYESAPEVLLLHIQANEWSNVTGGYIKPEYHIIYGEILKYVFNIHNEVDGSSCKKINVSYKLTAVVHHMGTVTRGHYVTYRKYRKDWYLANDEQVEKVPFHCEIVPYVMVYEKMAEET